MNPTSILSNSNKIRILNILKKGKVDFRGVMKSTRLPETVLKSLLDELVRDGFVKEINGTYEITEVGLKALKYVGRVR